MEFTRGTEESHKNLSQFTVRNSNLEPSASEARVLNTVCVCTYIYIFVYVRVCLCVCMYVCMYVCTYVNHWVCFIKDNVSSYGNFQKQLRDLRIGSIHCTY